MLTIEDIVVKAVIKNPEVIKKIEGKIDEALGEIDIKEIIKESIGQTVIAVFESNRMYSLIEKPLRIKLAKIIAEALGGE